jgi:hypothetical protein
VTYVKYVQLVTVSFGAIVRQLRVVVHLLFSRQHDHHSVLPSENLCVASAGKLFYLTNVVCLFFELSCGIQRTLLGTRPQGRWNN